MSQALTPTVCAVIVTFKRQELLRACLTAVLSQTRSPDAVLVVDNHSQDGTLEMLRAEFPTVEVLALPDNRGGAGGFHAGMRHAYALGYDFLWVMDDDGCADACCLEHLYHAAQGEPGVYGAVCVRPDDPTKLSFPAPLGDEFSAQTRQLNALEGAMDKRRVLRGWAAFMNAILFPRDVIERAGLPRAEMFIWGDEVEYAKRIKASGIPIFTVFDARHVHPPDRIVWQSALRPDWQVYAGPLDWKSFCFFRNAGLLARHYGRGKGASMLARYFYFYLVQRRGDWGALQFFLRAYRAGWRGDFARRVPF